MRVSLRPERDVEIREGRFVASSAEPWLALDGPSPLGLAGRLIELTYRMSFWDEPVRPVFRFWLRDGRFVDRIAPGPIMGAGIWTGRMPRTTSAISISPTNRPGRFDVHIEALRARAWPAVLAAGFRQNPRAARSALLTRFIGWTPESDVNLTWASAAHPVDDYAAWAAPRARPIDLEDIDRPRFDWRTATAMRIIVIAHEGTDLARTLDSLRAQVFPHWTAVVVGDRPANFLSDPRMIVRRRETLEIDDGFTTVLRAGDILRPVALACVAEQAQRYPACRLFYGDALRAAAGTAVPALMPGWSPRLFATLWPLDGPVFVKDLKSWPEAAQRHFVDEGRLPPSMAEVLTTSNARPLRRLLLETDRRQEKPSPVQAMPAARVARTTIIIPTRDHPALLRRAVASIRALSRPDSYQLVIVDNGSLTDAAKTLDLGLAASPDLLVLRRPGPFNFSLMCNDAAAVASGDVLLFLNDDTEVLSAGWLDRLVAHAATPGIGAVGAKLTYPDGRLQHVGIVAGLGESAGHFGALDAADATGWAGRNVALHEVSAVTGACLAVARAKFEAVGGFDAEHLPVELSDVDLCFKLNARGWQTVVDPAVHLMHRESASRGGATFRRLDVYERQRAVFVARWRHVLRDDPFFHPGLSLYSWRAALG